MKDKEVRYGTDNNTNKIPHLGPAPGRIDTDVPKLLV